MVISSRKQQACDEVAAAINDQHGDGTAIAVAVNISSKDDLQHLVDETKRPLATFTSSSAIPLQIPITARWRRLMTNGFKKS